MVLWVSGGVNRPVSNLDILRACLTVLPFFFLAPVASISFGFLTIWSIIYHDSSC